MAKPNLRGQRRLEIARRLMALPDGGDVMAELQKLPAADREQLRGLVDWVEEYEMHERSTS